MFHDIDQNCDEWLDLRSGKLTGSAIGKIMANYGKAFGEPAKALAANIACEQVTGRRSLNDSYSNAHMERGHEQEPLARKLYEDTFFTDVLNGGFFDNGNTGCSPDGRINDVGLIEIKSVIISVHHKNIKRGCIDPAYKWQHYFNLKESGCDWIDFNSFCIDFPLETRLFTFRTHKDECEEEFKMIDGRTAEFFKLVESNKPIILGKVA